MDVGHLAALLVHYIIPVHLRVLAPCCVLMPLAALPAVQIIVVIMMKCGIIYFYGSRVNAFIISFFKGVCLKYDELFLLCGAVLAIPWHMI